MTNKEKYWVLKKNWKRHGAYSGYEQIIQHLSHWNVPGFRVFFFLSEYFKKKTRILNYSSLSFSKEVRILISFPYKKRVHVLYGDMDYYYLQLLKNHVLLKKLNNKIIATFHHPPKELEKRLGYDRVKILGAIDKIIVMGRNQIPFFQKFSSAEIKFIPHGIDINFFKPDYSWTKNNQILIIGVSHRDHQLNRKIIQKTRERAKDIQFKVVVPEKVAGFYKGLNNVDLITKNISDDELLRFYQNSRGILLMLNDCTASNTLLESLATGCPLIVNNVGAVRDYISEGSGIPVFDKRNISSIVDYLVSLCSEDSKFRSISERQVEIAAQYDWTIISAATEQFINR